MCKFRTFLVQDSQISQDIALRTTSRTSTGWRALRIPHTRRDPAADNLGTVECTWSDVRRFRSLTFPPSAPKYLYTESKMKLFDILTTLLTIGAAGGMLP